MKQPLWLKYRKEVQSLQEQVEKKKLEVRLMSLEGSRQKKREELAELEKAMWLARAKYERERYCGLIAYASGLIEEFEVNEVCKFSFVFRLSARAFAMAVIFMRVNPKLKWLEDEIKKLGGKSSVKAQRKKKGKEDKNG